MHLGQQGRILRDVNRQIVGVNFEVRVGPLEIVQLLRHAEQVDEVVPFMDEVDGYAATQRLVRAVDRAVIDARPPIRQIAGADDPRAVGVQRGQQVLEGQHHTAPAHGGRDVGFLVGGQIAGQVQARLLGRKDRLFDKKCLSAPAHLLQCFGMQAGGVGDEHHIILRGGIGQVGVLRVQQVGHAVPQGALQVAAQRVGLQGPAAVGAEVMHVF